MPAPKALIFDLDGVLVDSEPLHRATWIEAFQQFDFTLSPEEEPYLQGRRAEQVVAWLRERHGEAVAHIDPADLVRHKRELFYRRMQTELQAVPGVDAFLRRHKGEIPLGLVTSAGLKTVGKIMLLFNWRNIFDALIGAEHVANVKPHPEPFQKAAARFRIEPSECLVFEDSAIGIEAARRAGASICGVTTTVAEAELREAGARWTIRDFTDEKSLAEALNGSSPNQGMFNRLRNWLSPKP